MKFSVLLSIYKKESPAYFKESLKSIWDDQTLKPNQIILVEDGPLGSELTEIVSEWQNKLGKTLKVIKLPSNLGLGGALNIGLTHCDHGIVARMDTDDIAMPTRFEYQVKFLNDYPKVDILGSFADVVNKEKQIIGQRTVPTTHEEIIKQLWACPIVHPAVIFKKDIILKVGSYSERLKRRQDYELWFRCALAGATFANIPLPLIRYRFSNETYDRNRKVSLSQAIIGFKGSRALNLSVKAHVGVFYPLFRSFFPLSLMEKVDRVLNCFDPRR